MSVVSGVISRKVLLACGNLCFLCRAMRAREDIFPLGQNEEPNDRKIRKLCEYAAQNPLRIPKVWFMGEHSHVSAEFDNAVSVVLENYACPLKNSEDLDVNKPDENQWTQEVLKVEGHVSSSPEVAMVLSWKTIVNEKDEVNVSTEDAKNPSFWSRVCLHNMVLLAREATTKRDSGVLVPLH